MDRNERRRSKTRTERDAGAKEEEDAMSIEENITAGVNDRRRKAHRCNSRITGLSFNFSKAICSVLKLRENFVCKPQRQIIDLLRMGE